MSTHYPHIAITLPESLLAGLRESALLVVDDSPTFMPGGELPVPGGDAVLAPTASFIRTYGRELGLIVFSRDWHPLDHCSFADTPEFTDGSWPAHGVANTENACVHPALIAVCKELHLPYITISKGMLRDVEAYSAYDGVNLDFDNSPLAKELADYGITRVFVCGLAGEICVLATALSARELGTETVLLHAATGFLGDDTTALARMRDAGVIVI
jgi:nicotinamidase/pyrazinamidase